MTGSIDDHLGLLTSPLEDRRLVVFTGMSGSGKSTCIDLLLTEHPRFAGRDATRIGPAPIAWPVAEPDTELVVVDEISRIGELRHVARLLRRGHLLLVASHLPPAWIRVFGLRWSAVSFRTDRSSEKLGRALARRGIHHTPERLLDFVRAFGANYTDLEIILERSDCSDFDVALERFERSASIVRTRKPPPAQGPTGARRVVDGPLEPRA